MVSDVINTLPVHHEREEVNEFLTLTTRPAATAHGASKLLILTNHSPDLMAKFSMSIVAEVPVEVLGGTASATPTTTAGAKGVSGRPCKTYTVTVYPRQRVEFLRAPFVKHDGRQVQMVGPDRAFFVRECEEADARVAYEMTAVKLLIKEKQPSASTPGAKHAWTSEAVANACAEAQQTFVDIAFPPLSLSPTRSGALARVGEDPPVALSQTANPIFFQRPEQLFRGTSKLRSTLPPPTVFNDDEKLGPSIHFGHVRQGALGDCYLCCAMACLATVPQLIRDAFPTPCAALVGCGVHRVLLCKHGWWQSVVVDELLPTQSGRLSFARNSVNPSVLWVPLLEKAYAKVHGSYGAIRAGDAPLAMMDLLGCPYSQLKALPMFEEKDDLFSFLRDGLAAQKFLVTLLTPNRAASVTADAYQQTVKRYDAVGLSVDHVYSVLDAVELPASSTPGAIRLVRLRDPWAGGTNGKTWTGPFATLTSPEWTPSLLESLRDQQAAVCRSRRTTNDALKARRQEATKEDSETEEKSHGGEASSDEEPGCFWMRWEDAVTYFLNGGLCWLLRGWPQLRVQASLELRTGLISRCLRISVGPSPAASPTPPERSALRCYFGLHQRDRKCLFRSGPNASVAPSPSSSAFKYQSVLLSVVCMSEETGQVVRVVANSDARLTFGTYRDVFVECALEPNIGTKEYYVVVAQALTTTASSGGGSSSTDDIAPAAVAPVVLSMLCDQPHRLLREVTIWEVQPGLAVATRAPFNPPIKFRLDSYPHLAHGAVWQTRITSAAGDVQVATHSGPTVDAKSVLRPLDDDDDDGSAATEGGSLSTMGAIEIHDSPPLNSVEEKLIAVESSAPIHTAPRALTNGGSPAMLSRATRLSVLVLDASLTATAAKLLGKRSLGNESAESLISVRLSATVKEAAVRGSGNTTEEARCSGSLRTRPLSCNRAALDERDDGFSAADAGASSDNVSDTGRPVPGTHRSDTVTDVVAPLHVEKSASDVESPAPPLRFLWCEAFDLPVLRGRDAAEVTLHVELVCGWRAVLAPSTNSSAETQAAARSGMGESSAVGASVDEAVVATGKLVLRDRGLMLGGEGQMATVSLLLEKATEDSESETVCGEMHMGISWLEQTT